jgi:iron complex outermembrane receptor protein
MRNSKIRQISKIKWLVTIVLIFVFHISQAQIKDTIYLLKPVEVEAFRTSMDVVGVKTDRIDTTFIKAFSNGNLAELLQQSTLLSIRNNGVSGIGIANTRGTGSSQTVVLWNGLNLQSPMNGGIDLSALRVSETNKINIQYSGVSALYGSGAMGGAISVSGVPEFKKRFIILGSATIGSFDNYGGDVILHVSNRHADISLRAFYLSGVNDFRYKNVALFDSVMKQQHAQTQRYGMVSENSFKISTHDIISLRLWYQRKNSNLPPLMIQGFSDASQEDENLRVALEWQNTGKKYKFIFRSAYLQDHYLYEEPIKELHSPSHSNGNISEAEINVRIFPFHTLLAGFHYEYFNALTDNYGGAKHRDEAAIFVSYIVKSKKDKWKANLNLRQAYSLRKFVPLVPSIGFEAKLWKNLKCYVNASRNYRNPTMNDLYWNPGGNPDLKPEQGLSEELGFNYSTTFKKYLLKLDASGFNNNLKNGIQWLPSGTYWSPRNIQNIWVRGFELSVSNYWNLEKLSTFLIGKLSYTRSSQRKSYSEALNGKQMLYIPYWIAVMNYGISYKKFNVLINVEYYSKRYTDVENSAFLKGYCLGNIHLSKDFARKNFTISLFVKINNLWNQSYQSYVYQAMPGINFTSGLTLKFNK